MASYAKTAVNKLGRLPKRATYDAETIHTLVDTSPVLHVSFVDPTHPFPVVLPMIGCTAEWEGETFVYLHGYVSGRMFKSAPSGPQGQDEQGLPITISATHLDGLVLSLTPFHNSCNYRSAVVYGHATRLSHSEAEEEFAHALKRITNNLLPLRYETSRAPNATELASTAILKVRITSASAKIRTGGPSEEKKDLEDKELRKGVWTGVVPFWGTWGEPIPSKENLGDAGAGGVEAWRVRETGKGRSEAFGAAGEE